MGVRKNLQEQKKATFTLPVALLDEVRHLVQEGDAPSQSALVVEALEKEIRSRRMVQLREEYRQAAADPHFLRDIDDTSRDFAAADAESARMIP
jgi:Arc/MetJ-type ribon-helix-helix transcriptional regulator